jgi:beta-galactosidase
MDFNSNWRFRKDEEIEVACRDHGLPDVPNPEPRQWQKAGWQSLSRPDNPHIGSWRTVELPHDFLIEGEFTEDAPWKTGSLPYGKAWYVKDFELAKTDLGKRILVEFDGIYRDSQVYVNGHFIGRRMSGYVSVRYDISEVCNYGEPNRIAVFADATQTEQWSYQGGGIYRAARMVVADAVHVAHRGLQIQTKNSGAIELAATIANESYEKAQVTVEAEVLKTGAQGEGAVTVAAQETGTATVRLKVDQPQLWSLEDPQLYKLRVTLRLNGEAIDRCEECFGFRSIRFSAKNGFLLNGKRVKIKGTCCHQDFAGVGVAVPPELQEWRVLQLKALGCNAIRTSHNMPDPALLDACDKHGMLIMEETRLPGCAEELLRDVADTIRRDRNHPCVILWSLANEEPIMTTAVGARVFKKLHQLVHSLDPTRPTTCAVVGNWFKAAELFEANGFRLDVFGMNYRHGCDSENFDRFHEKYPDWPFIQTESWGGFTTRGLYESTGIEVLKQFAEREQTWESEAYRNYVSAYGTTFAGYGSRLEECWQDCVSRPHLAGTFLWTGFDYRGETAPHGWPAVISHFGMLDLCGFRKELAQYLRCWWRAGAPHTFLMPHWNWPGRAGEPIRVRCYSNAAEIELRLNGRIIAREPMPAYDRLEWQVPYEPGLLEAIGYDQAGAETSRANSATASEPAQLALSSKVIGDIAVVNAAVQDADGTLCPLADNTVEFEVSVGGEILGVGNGNPYSHEPVKFTNQRQAYMGLCQVIVRRIRTDAKIAVSAKAPQLTLGRIAPWEKTART